MIFRFFATYVVVGCMIIIPLWNIGKYHNSGFNCEINSLLTSTNDVCE